MNTLDQRSAAATPELRSAVTEVPAADPARARQHFASLLELETDCWDVHHALFTQNRPDFVLVDVRSSEAYGSGHIEHAVNMPHQEIDEEALARLPDRLLVVYCWGPHCNGADKAAARLAALGRPVKKMIGGVTGWKDEGFELVTG